MQRLTVTTITAVEKPISYDVHVDLWPSHWSLSCRSNLPGHSECLKSTFVTPLFEQTW